MLPSTQFGNCDMNNRLDPIFVRAQIDALRVAYPDIADDEDQWLLTLESESELAEFLAAVARRYCAAEKLVEATGDEMSDLKARRERFEQRCNAMRGLAHKVLDWAGLRKFEVARATFSIRAGVPRVLITDEARLPPDCIRTRTEPDKLKIKEHLARGEPVPGAELSNSEPVISVRIK